ncbi:neurotrophin 1 [Drosophila ananassae]|uniref:Neurotrophin 1 n=1 Tax=Drosophila ananassae TaxID=7217 RepID=B3M939_DROAN|nr:uncharacterized protein LOC6507359 [Drosophila ananassae]EDV38983.1 neurotrophin 1 [Drosophila ananassae]
MPMLRIYLLILIYIQIGQGIKVETPSQERALNSTAKVPVYRVSKPEPKQPENRVPPHLQDIRPGYVDDDAGDVIRIIEPPQHFQHLKRLRQRQPPTRAVVWEQPRKLVTNRGKTVPTGDLLTQETQIQNAPNQLQLPVEILASVRKTERLLQRQRQKMPFVRQRHIQRQTHTLIAQNTLEQQLYQRGQDQRLRAVLSHNQEHKRKKRVKREIPEEKQQKREGKAVYDVQQGLKLVAHIGDLLKNATQYLPDSDGANNELTNEVKRPPTILCRNATNCSDSRRRRQRLFKAQAKSAEREKLRERRRHFRNEAITTTTTATTTTATTSSSKPKSPILSATPAISGTPLASRLVNSRKSKSKIGRSDDSILYADVMTNIRNLWQEHDLLSGPTYVAPGEVANNTDYRSLDMYLKELDQLSKKLPTAAPITGLNKEELARPTSSPNWFLINQDGKIYETRLDSQTKPSSTLFHRFPDMPNKNETVSTLDLE